MTSLSQYVFGGIYNFKMSTFIILQARTGSSRLPNKMLMPFFEDNGILEILLNRIRRSFPKDFDKLIVATTVKSGDDRIAELCSRLGIPCFRGDENDVLGRFIAAADSVGADKIIRVCADNVFLDTAVLNRLYSDFDNSDVDYMSFKTSDGTPSIKTHYGFWAEAVKTNALRKVVENTSDKLYHEHVTNYIYTHPEQFSIELTPLSLLNYDIEAYPNLRLTIDTADDFYISQQIFKDLASDGVEITTENILEYLKGHTNLFKKMEKIIKQNAK